jgi:hypothetical protein
MLDSGDFPWRVVLALSIAALRFSVDFDWWNGVEGLGARLDELCVRSREPDAWTIRVYTWDTKISGAK